MAYRGYTQAANKANQKYQKKAYDQVAVRVPKGKRDEYKELAARNGESLAGMIARLLDAETETITLKPLDFIAEKIRRAAKDVGQTVEDYILDAVDARMAVDENGADIPPEILAGLIDWLESHGHTDEEVADCFKHLSNT